MFLHSSEIYNPPIEHHYDVTECAYHRVAPELRHDPHRDGGIISNTDDWLISKKDPLLKNWKVIVGRSKKLPIDFHLIQVDSGFSIWDSTGKIVFSPEGYLHKILQIYNRYAFSNWGEWVGIDHIKRREEGSNHVLYRSYIIGGKKQRPYLCNVYFKWNDCDPALNSSRIAYILITKYDVFPIDEESIKYLDEEARSLFVYLQ